jgi:hypothetical protein
VKGAPLFEGQLFTYNATKTGHTKLKGLARINFTAWSTLGSSMDELYPLSGFIMYPQTPYLLTVLGLMMFLMCLLAYIYPVAYGTFDGWLVYSLITFMMAAVIQLSEFEKQRG